MNRRMILSGIMYGILGYLVALLPERIQARESFSQFQSAAAHVFSGITECLLALLVLVYGYDSFIGRFGPGVSNAMAGSQASLLESQVRGMGVLGFLLYLMHPTALISFYLMLEGTVRTFGALTAGRSYGLGILWAIDRVILLVNTRRQAAVLRSQLGPYEADCIAKDEASGTLALTSVEQKDWHERQVVSYGDEFYIRTTTAFIRKGQYYRYRYFFKRMHPGEIIRGRLVVLPTALYPDPQK